MQLCTQILGNATHGMVWQHVFSQCMVAHLHMRRSQRKAEWITEPLM